MPNKIRDISEITAITNKLGETLSNTNKPPLSKKELTWFLKMDTQKNALFVQTNDGRRGLLYMYWFPVADSSDPDDQFYCKLAGIGNSEAVLHKIVSLAKKIKKTGFEPFIGKNTGPFDQHELGGFIEAFTPPNNQTDTWLEIVDV